VIPNAIHNVRHRVFGLTDPGKIAPKFRCKRAVDKWLVILRAEYDVQRDVEGRMRHETSLPEFTKRTNKIAHDFSRGESGGRPTDLLFTAPRGRGK